MRAWSSSYGSIRSITAAGTSFPLSFCFTTPSETYSEMAKLPFTMLLAGGVMGLYDDTRHCEKFRTQF